MKQGVCRLKDPENTDLTLRSPHRMIEVAAIDRSRPGHSGDDDGAHNGRNDAVS